MGGRPEGSSLALAEALNNGSFAAATACFARDASFLTPDATAVRGREDIGAILAQLIAMRPRIEIDMRSTLRAGEVALVSERWTIRFRARGESLVQSADACFVARCIEGAWKLLIAAPWGWPGQPPQPDLPDRRDWQIKRGIR